MTKVYLQGHDLPIVQSYHQVLSHFLHIQDAGIIRTRKLEHPSLLRTTVKNNILCVESNNVVIIIDQSMTANLHYLSSS